MGESTYLNTCHLYSSSTNTVIKRNRLKKMEMDKFGSTCGNEKKTTSKNCFDCVHAALFCLDKDKMQPSSHAFTPLMDLKYSALASCNLRGV